MNPPDRPDDPTVDPIGEAWRAARAELDQEVDPAVSWLDVQRRMRSSPRMAPKLERYPERRAKIWRWVAASSGIAAVLVVVLLLASVSHIYRTNTAFREFATPVGARATLTLRDGTRLVLAPDSRIRIPANFGARSRDVALEGEALFTVVHDTHHPFHVTTGNATIQDIGTTFDVRAYADDKNIRVAVMEGEVGAAHTGAQRIAMLTAGDMGLISDTAIAVSRRANVARYMVWSQGGLAFDGVPLREAVRDLERTYNLTITLADSSLAAEHVTATFSNEPSDEVLTEVTGIVGATFTRSGRTVTIRRRPANAHPAHSPPVPGKTVQRFALVFPSTAE